MLHMVLLVLKIIGFVILGILGLLLGLMLLVLFVPVRYRINGSYYEKPQGTLQITWLLHILSIRIFLEEEMDISLRLFGFRLFKDGIRADMPDKDTSDEPGGEWNGESREESAKAPHSEENTDQPPIEDPLIGPKTEYTKPEPETHEEKQPFLNEEISNRLSRVLEKIKFLFYAVCDKLKHIKEYYHPALDFLKNEENQNTIKLILRQIKALFRHILPRKASGNITFGFDDPYTTGQVLAAASIFYAWYGQNIQIIPMFEDSVLEGELKLKGRIRMGTLLWLGLRVFLNKNFRVLLRRWRNKGGI